MVGGCASGLRACVLVGAGGAAGARLDCVPETSTVDGTMFSFELSVRLGGAILGAMSVQTVSLVHAGLDSLQYLGVVVWYWHWPGPAACE